MVQKIKQANIWGRVGSGLAQGMGLQIPKEMEQYRLAQGIKNLENQTEDLTPIEQYGRYASVPGITPQMLQSFGDLLKTQNQGNAIRRSAGRMPGEQPPQAGGPQASPNMPPSGGINIIPITPMAGGAPSPMPQGSSVSQQPSPQAKNASQEETRPQILENNPLAEQYMPRGPWSPQQRQERMADYLDQGFLPDQASQLAADDERRYREEPETYEARNQLLTKRQQEARDALARNIETKLQKTGEGTFKDLPGTVKNRLERGMERDLRLKPNSTLEDVADKWGEKAYRYTRAKNEVTKLAKTTGIENWIKGSENFDKLKSLQKIFADSGSQEEYRSQLQSELNMSPQGSSSVAFEMSKPVNQYLSNFKPIPYGKKNADLDNQARKAAIEIERHLQKDDSLLAIAFELSRKQPQFDQKAFFNQLTSDMEDQSFNPRQREEIAEGTKGIVPYWGDFFVIPSLSR